MLFLYRGWNSGTNQAILQAWRTGVRELEISVHNVCPLVWDRVGQRIKALPHALRRGGAGIFRRGTGRFTDAVKRSVWCMEEVLAAVNTIQRQEDFDFCLSIGSVLPVINQTRPVYIYTDLTIRANLYYPRGDEWVQLWRECLPYEEETLHRARRVFTMSDHVARSLVEHYGIPAERVLRVNGGCNTPPIANPDPERYAQARVLFVGVDWERKGGPELVEAFRRVRERHSNATLTIIGCKPRVKGPGIEVAGYVSQEQVPHFLEHGTLFCMPSKREPFGIAYLEAMQAGLPVIGSNLGAAPDFIINGETGYTVDPWNIEELSRRIDEIVGDPAKARSMGENGKCLVESQYTWERTQQCMWKAIRESLE
jgi:glycosyltransferase involved in cell wall biosynthesis